MRGEGILVKLEDVFLDCRSDSLPPRVVQRFVNQNGTVQVDAQPKRLMIEFEVKPRQPRRIYQRDELMFRAPGITGNRRIGKSNAKDAVPGNSSSLEDGQGFTFLGSETLHRKAIEGSDAHWQRA